MKRPRSFRACPALQALEPRGLLNGSLDATFGGDGRVLIDLPPREDGSPQLPTAFAAAIQADGKILVAGEDLHGQSFVVARLNTNGTLDASFGVGGATTIPIPGGVRGGEEILVRDDGKILIVGSTGGSTESFAIARLERDGTPDVTFDSDGVVVVGETSSVGGAALTPDGGILIGGERTRSMGATILVRLCADGSLDPSFGDGGRLGSDALPPRMRGIDALAVQFDGAIVVAATGLGGGLLEYAEGYLVARLGPSGSLDTRFGVAGMATIDFGVSGEVLHDLAIQADGKIVVAGEAGEGFAVARLGPDGTADVAFDGDGRAVIAFADTSAARSVAIDADGRVILAGFVNAAGVTGAFGWDFAVARLTSAGALDLSFSSDGRATVDFGESNAPRSDEAVAVALQAEDGKIVVMGSSDDVPGFRTEAPYMFAVARLKVVADGVDEPPIERDPPEKPIPRPRPRPFPDPRIHFFYGLSKRRRPHPSRSPELRGFRGGYPGTSRPAGSRRFGRGSRPSRRLRTPRKGWTLRPAWPRVRRGSGRCDEVGRRPGPPRRGRLGVFEAGFSRPAGPSSRGRWRA
ncbi:hypothetical protein [Paludisphaera soli]|uniref:hypothetical protein n=1 Tax=Paludisphaera soli TaxID=2712865 RepID=UPI0013ED14D9|nr:hypothetical protein [Paludisphaera soli]